MSVLNILEAIALGSVIGVCLILVISLAVIPAVILFVSREEAQRDREFLQSVEREEHETAEVVE